MGRNTPDADAVGMGHIDGACCGDKLGDMVRFLRERERGNKGEERGSARRGRRAGGRVTKRRRKREGNGGVWYGEQRCGVESRPDAGKGEVHSAQRWRALHDAAATRKWRAKDPMPIAFVGHVAK